MKFQTLLFNLTLIQGSLSANINWSSPVTVFSSGTYSASRPVLVVHSTSAIASGFWLATGDDYRVQTALFQASSWGDVQDLAISPHPQSSLQAVIDPEGDLVAVWKSRVDESELPDHFFEQEEALTHLLMEENEEEDLKQSPLLELVYPDDETETSLDFAFFRSQPPTQEVTPTTHSASKPQLKKIYSAEDIWIVATRNNGMGWDAPTPLLSMGVLTSSGCLRLANIQDGVSLISWRDTMGQMLGATYQDGGLGLTFSMSQTGLSITNSAVASTSALFNTLEELYSVKINPDYSVTNRIAFPRPVQDASFHIDLNTTQEIKAFIIQDQKTKFLICGIDDGTKINYTTIATLQTPVVATKILIGPIDNFPVAIWEMTNGTIQAARFDGHRWVDTVTLSTKGADPNLAIDPTTNHIICVWADWTLGETHHTIFTAEFNRSRWSSPQPLSAGGYAVSKPQIQFNSNGFGLILWSRQATSESPAIIEASTSS